MNFLILPVHVFQQRTICSPPNRQNNINAPIMQYIDFANERFAFELKLSSKKALTDGKTQLVDYLQRLSLDSGW